MGIRLVLKVVTLNDLDRVVAVILRYFTAEFLTEITYMWLT